MWWKKRNNTFSFFVQRYFSAYLIGQHNYGTNTIESYRDTFRLLLTYIENNCKKKKNLMLQDIPNQLIIDFLNWLISDRGNSSSTRNVRLAHLKSFFHFVKMEEPSLYNHCEQIINIPFTKWYWWGSWKSSSETNYIYSSEWKEILLW